MQDMLTELTATTEKRSGTEAHPPVFSYSESQFFAFWGIFVRQDCCREVRSAAHSFTTLE